MQAVTALVDALGVEAAVSKARDGGAEVAIPTNGSKSPELVAPATSLRNPSGRAIGAKARSS